MAKEELIELDGIVDEVLPDSRYRVKLDNGIEVGAYASGRIRKHRIRILAGDRVTLEVFATQSDGSISIESAPDAATTVRLRCPVARAVAILPVQAARGFGLYLLDRIRPLREAVMREGVEPAAQPRLMRGEAI